MEKGGTRGKYHVSVLVFVFFFVFSACFFSTSAYVAAQVKNGVGGY